MSASRRRVLPSVEALIVATYGLLGLRLGARAIADNSAFLHLRTGIDMVSHGVIPAIPRVDPYSFTARGEPWVVQSWLPSAIVGWVHRALGAGAIVVLSGVAMAGLAVVVVSLARTGDARRTLVAGFATLAVGAPFWTPRPLLVGLLCLAATIWIVERQRAFYWFVPLGWIWVNSHGSFVLGLLWVVLRTAGDAFDERRRPDFRAVGYFVAGLGFAMLNPLGIKLLTFPLTVGDKSEIFRTVTEWRTVDFQRPDGLVALVGLVIAGLVLTRRPLPWRHALPVAAFLGIGLLAQRNLSPLGIVLAPALGSALRVPLDAADPRLGRDTRVPAVFAAVLGGLASLFLIVGATRPAFDFSSYPAREVRWLSEQRRFDAPHRLITHDTVGNFIELRRGRDANVFIDDRVDMYPLEVSRDFAKVLRAGRPAERVLSKWKIDTVLWESGEPLVDRLLDSGDWTRVRQSRDWVVLYRR